MKATMSETKKDIDTSSKFIEDMDEDANDYLQNDSWTQGFAKTWECVFEDEFGNLSL
eukprot:CAMPEP_0114688948 /NCGR_PEP_ID=MMETSP0191-20121206/64008_1 /TAXON_ID=126664 /ORGANISM="Sorites sp." /LENGTH=56 /DNA_ID=CAMNT_0001976981 /DNA_START=1 /DNA_END=168 /DNA_ORIENTATION=-